MSLRMSVTRRLRAGAAVVRAAIAVLRRGFWCTAHLRRGQVGGGAGALPAFYWKVNTTSASNGLAGPPPSPSARRLDQRISLAATATRLPARSARLPGCEAPPRRQLLC